LDAASIFRYARRYADRHEKAGRGTQFPTVRQAAKRFGVKQSEIEEVVYSVDHSEINGCEYMGLSVGCRIRAGWATHDSLGDFEIEAYREEAKDA
jgi:vacuolar-type H+-ATPase catalytic subunit A/Vma1